MYVGVCLWMFILFVLLINSGSKSKPEDKKKKEG